MNLVPDWRQKIMPMQSSWSIWFWYFVKVTSSIFESVACYHRFIILEFLHHLYTVWLWPSLTTFPVIKYEKKVWKVPRYYDTYINMRITRNSNSAIEFIKVMEHDTFMLFSMNGHSCIWFWCHLLNHINMILFKMSTRLFLRIYIFLGYWFIYGEICVC
jgi:hypothetical protein